VDGRAADAGLVSARPVRAPVASLILAGVACALLGCGTSRGGAAVPARPPLTTATAVAYAHAVNLRAGDVPGMTAITAEGERKRRKRGLCGLSENVNRLVDIHSPAFRRGTGLQVTQIGSDVEVVSTPAQADEKLARARAAIESPGTLACIERLSTRAFFAGAHRRSDPSVRVALGRVGASVLQPGVPASFGLRIAVPVKVGAAGARGAIEFTTYVDSVGFVVGRGLVSLTVASYSGPPPAGLERHIVALLYGRAVAYRL
jgi:hypothetical protein